MKRFGFRSLRNEMTDKLGDSLNARLAAQAAMSDV